ncbi:hypothetical protein A6O24_10660 [Acidithiobacillus thiooxidans]|uniref:Tyrosine specific protein phosphatases domain-containing protein n=2 Tax=Acidithiobacillus thiooxidans TaxID=930 RepID=A0A1C2J5I9_ACITH|nr:hypothetical protein [Acidithiobacillus thiooxidans]OCX69726.1 hypothetical protein A6P07_15790 [Acidithiobacillus thiooxidans]OCX74294.1 hypothetical protein A6O24_10660 [Acidithiobacillus thiooxidans]OCX83488.1 hypothetical protein A6O26_07090 [Acidithiobacillus thiooxidans]OFC50318.1 hypothetical protein BAE47_03185 [Acidithiobacillus thiooxidans]
MEDPALYPDAPLMFLSRKKAEALSGAPGSVIISITDPGKRLADLQGYSEDQILRLSFDDVDEVARDLPLCWDPENDPPKDLPLWRWFGVEWFLPAHAREILHFVDRQPAAIRFRVHCEKGESRSAAVARWIAGYRKLPEPPGISIPNERVLRLLARVSETNHGLVR